MKNENAFKKIIRLGMILFAFSAVMAFCLGMINNATADRIAAINKETLDNAMKEVLAADEYKEISYDGGDSRIVAVYEAVDAGYTVDVLVVGSQGNIEMIVGVDKEGVISGISLIASSETSGLGAIAASASEKGQAFRAQFAGKSGVICVDKDGGEIEALTGATITSRAVCDAATAALDAVKTLG